MPSKYKAVRTEVDGYKFASKAEARRYAELKLLVKAGEISRLELQPRYKLVATGGWPIGEYRGDFRYLSKHGERVVEDVKGFMTPLAKWKIKHFEAQYGLKVEIIK